MKDFNVILDLDQTLISAEAEEDYDFNKNKNKAKLFNFKDMDGYYIVFERPNLQSFLDYLFENFNVSVWTAASKDYALFIIEKIILCDNPKRKLDWIFFSYHCDISKKITKHTKDLSMLWDVYKIDNYERSNTLIIDDYDEVYNTQKDNCIHIKGFEFLDKNSHKDKHLKYIKKELQSMDKNDVKAVYKINQNMQKYD